jgi:hypothetical protein
MEDKAALRANFTGLLAPKIRMHLELYCIEKTTHKREISTTM